MTTVYLARHGESDWNVERRWQGHADRPLTDRGREQARDLAARLADVELAAVYASDLRRAWETAEAVASSQGLEVVRLPELREVDVGSWSGCTREECAERFPAAFARWQAGGSGWDDGELYEAMGERVVAAIRRIAAEHPVGTVLVVSHGGPHPRRSRACPWNRHRDPPPHRPCRAERPPLLGDRRGRADLKARRRAASLAGAGEPPQTGDQTFD